MCSKRLGRPFRGAAAGGFADAGELLALQVGDQVPLDAGEQAGALVDETGVELQQGGAGLDLGDGRGAGIDAAAGKLARAFLSALPLLAR